MAEPIIITGTPRSGLAIVARVFRACGGWVSPRVRAQRGRRPFGDDRISESLVRPFMRGIGCDPRCQHPLPVLDQFRDKALTVSTPWRGFVQHSLRDDGYDSDGDGVGPWLYTGADACILWPVWHAAFPNARWIIVRRDTESIARSCIKTGYMNAFSSMADWRTWVQEYGRRFNEMEKAGLSISFIWPTQFLAGQTTDVQRAVNGISDLKWSRPAVEQVLLPILWNRGIYEIKE